MLSVISFCSSSDRRLKSHAMIVFFHSFLHAPHLSRSLHFAQYVKNMKHPRRSGHSFGAVSFFIT
jgi:hypothetical protein